MKMLKLFPILAIMLLMVLNDSCKKVDDDPVVPPIDNPTTNTMVKSTDPVNGETDVVPTKNISIIFSEEIDPQTINASTFTLKQGSVAVSGAVSYTGKKATFTPTNSLTLAAIYTATIASNVKNIVGKAIASSVVWNFTIVNSISSLAVVNLGTSANYVILAKTAIKNSPISVVTGDLGLSPAATSYITGLSITNATGYATSAQVTGTIYAADMVTPTSGKLTTAVNNMITAYNDAAGRPSPDFSELGSGNIGGKTLTPGLYKWTSSVTLPTDVTISGGSGDVWIFQISGDLNMSTSVKVILSGGAKAENIFWQVAGMAIFGTTSHFEGIILCQTGITFQTGASFNGRALAQTAVILEGNTIVNP